MDFMSTYAVFNYRLALADGHIEVLHYDFGSFTWFCIFPHQ